MPPTDPFERPDQRRLRLFFYLIPLLGVLPALVCLYRQPTPAQQPQQTFDQVSNQKVDRAQQQALHISRQSVSLAFGWLVALALSNAGGQLGESSQLTVLLLNSVLTSGYFIASVWLMAQLARGKRPALPGLGLLGKHLPQAK